MSLTVLDSVRALDAAASQIPRIGLTELARSNGWRGVLEDSGIMEITDQSGTVAFILSYQTIRMVSQAISDLEDEIEQLTCEQLYAKRLQDADFVKTGDDLRTAALDQLKERRSARKKSA